MTIRKLLRLPPEVLPIVSIHAFIPFVLILSVGAPHRLEMEHVEIIIFLHLVKQINHDLIVVMCE